VADSAVIKKKPALSYHLQNICSYLVSSEANIPPLYDI